MRRTTYAVLFLMLAMLGVQFGCAAMQAEGPYWARIGERAIYQDTDSTQTAADRLHMHRRVIDQDAKSLIDDIDVIMLRERPSRLSRWHNR